MEWTAENQPSTFFAVCARLIGPEVKLTIEQQLPGNLSPSDWNLMMQIPGCREISDTGCC
jgi:hypothetical protein